MSPARSSLSPHEVEALLQREEGQFLDFKSYRPLAPLGAAEE